MFHRSVFSEATRGYFCHIHFRKVFFKTERNRSPSFRSRIPLLTLKTLGLTFLNEYCFVPRKVYKILKGFYIDLLKITQLCFYFLVKNLAPSPLECLISHESLLKINVNNIIAISNTTYYYIFKWNTTSIVYDIFQLTTFICGMLTLYRPDFMNLSHTNKIPGPSRLKNVVSVETSRSQPGRTSSYPTYKCSKISQLLTRSYLISVSCLFYVFHLFCR